MDKLKTQIRDIIKSLYDIDDVDVEFSEVPADIAGDYSTNVAMRLAKRVGKNPRQVAEEIIAQLGDEFVFSIAGPGFINIEISAKKLQEKLAAEFSENYGSNNSGEGKVALVEFPSTNMAKPYSVGHLRPGTQGWATKKLLEANGWKVITDNHLGDTGTPFGVWVVGSLRSGKAIDDVTIYDLGQIYIDTKKALKDEAAEGKHELADETQEWLKKHEAKDPQAVEYSERFNKISLDHIHSVMKRMSIDTDYELGESFYAESGKELVQKFLAEGKFEQNEDGSVICRLDEFGIDVPMLVLKSNGTALYATTDLSCMFYRAENYNPDLVVYCVGAEQKFYFEQLFAMAKKLGVPQKNVHLWFGTIDQVNEDGKREKMSSRKGVVLLEEMLNDAEARVRKNFGESNLDDEDIRRIATGAIKFSDFMADRKTGILYDPNKIFALTGFSGPFCQYADVRLRRILEKNKDFARVDFADYDFEEEKEVINILNRFPELVSGIVERLELHKIAAYCFELAQALNRYYEKTPISQAEDKERSARLWMVEKADFVLAKALDLLGVEIPEKM
jgi:arginyl-tRNA synthetase